MKVSLRIKSVAAVVTVGVATLALFQNCSSGSLPSELNNTSSAASAPTVATPQLLVDALSSVVASGTTLITISGGTLPYTPVAMYGSISKDALGDYIYTAPATAASDTITVTDGSGQIKSKAITVTAATTQDTTPAVTVVSKPIYEFLDPALSSYAYADNQSFGAGVNPTPKYYLASTQDTGSVPLYRCVLLLNTITTFFDTTHDDCEGVTQLQGQRVTLGYIYLDTSHAGTQPLYRWRNTFLYYVIHQETLTLTAPATPIYSTQDSQGNRGTVSGTPWLSDGLLGYVLTQ